jgi:hypothetical protein
MPNYQKRDDLLRRSSVAALVLGNADHGHELFYLCDRNSEQSIWKAWKSGLSPRGVVGLTIDGNVEVAVDEGYTPQETWLNNRIVEDGKTEFETALKLVHAPSAAA